jgi:Flp pilus assembly protein TadG
MVEFALILTPLLLVLLGIMQVGLILNAYVTIANAAREGSRTATVYLYDRALTKSQNDVLRADAARSALLTSMGMLSTSAPQFNASGTWTVSGSSWTAGDVIVSYSLPTGVTETDARRGQYVRVRMTYHLDLLVPFISAALPHDANGRMTLTSDVSMVVN